MAIGVPRINQEDDRSNLESGAVSALDFLNKQVLFPALNLSAVTRAGLTVDAMDDDDLYDVFWGPWAQDGCPIEKSINERVI